MEPAAALDPSSRVIENMSEKEIKRIEKRMRPGKWSGVGFLTKKQSLKDLITQDELVLRGNHILYEQIADYLDTLIGKSVHLTYGKNKPSSMVCISKIYAVSFLSTLGHQTCPFTTDKKKDCGEGQGSSDFKVRRLDTKEELSFPSLLPHLVRAHHFFEGGPYRTDPKALISFFDLKPGVDYKMKTKATISWIPIECGSGPTQVHRDIFEINYEKYQVFKDKKVQVFFLPHPLRKIVFNNEEWQMDAKECYLFVFSDNHDGKLSFSFKKGQEVLAFEDHFYPNSYAIYRMQNGTCPILNEEDGYLNKKQNFIKA